MEHKSNVFENGHRLTREEAQKGSLDGRKRYYSNALKCWFYLKDGQNFEEVERKYLKNR